MVTGTAFVALNRDESRIVLYGEIITDAACSITYKGERFAESFSRKEIVKEVIEGFLTEGLTLPCML